MSPRPKNNRMVLDPPRFRKYLPTGFGTFSGIPVQLLVEEYAAIRLCDYEMMTQAEASVVMHVSRPTFTRVYESARRKVAGALVESRPISIGRGEAMFDHEWYHCIQCTVFFNNPDEMTSSPNCPLCGSAEIEMLHKPDEPESGSQPISDQPEIKSKKSGSLKTAIAITESSTDSRLERHFGKSPFFLIFDEYDESIRIIPNPVLHKKGCKAGSLVDELIGHQVSRVIAGDFGTNIHQLFIQRKIQMIIHPDAVASASEILKLIKSKY